MRHRRVVEVLAGLALALGVAGPASAAPVTVITHEKNFVDTFVGVIGCDEGGPLYTVTSTNTRVTKETDLDDGTFHGMDHFTGDVVAIPLDGSLATYTGRWTAGGAFNGNTSTLISVYTLGVTLTGSDGSKNVLNEVIHFNELPDGAQNFFGRCNTQS
jgi:hypothetical protein